MGFSACIGTPYDRMYSNRVTHYKPPQEKKESAADLLRETEAKKTGMPAEAAPGMPAADPGIPGLGPAPADAAMPGGAPPMAPPPVPPPPP